VRRVPVRPEFRALFRLGSRNSSDQIYRNNSRYSPTVGYGDWRSHRCAHDCYPGVAAFQSSETPQLGPNHTLASLSLGFALFSPHLFQVAASHPADAAPVLANATLEIVALVLLFTPRANQWFQSAPQN
jgi:hypothetical protein